MQKTQKKEFAEIRIIGGKWRKRKLSLEISTELRPTKDRVRETLFNWLAPYIVGSRCLDCFAGTGALGFEALSRGASHVTFIDKSSKIIKKLKENAKILSAENIDYYLAEMPNFKKKLDPYDIIFLDPPYHKNLIEPCLNFLEKNNLLKDNTLIYIETEKTFSPLSIPENWLVLKENQAGQVAYYLLKTCK